MPTRFTIHLERSDGPIREVRTKFGGQPVWVASPAWPLSPAVDAPMQFVCQIVLPVEIVGDELGGKVAYFFRTDDTDRQGRYILGSYYGDGESAVIIQPGIHPQAVTTVELAEGPAIHYYDQQGPHDEYGHLAQRCYPEYLVTLERGHDPEFDPEHGAQPWNEVVDWNVPDPGLQAYCDALDGMKIGGTPLFLQVDEFPVGDDWIFLLQLEQLLDDCLNLGDIGTGYLFLSRDGTRSQFLVQE